MQFRDNLFPVFHLPKIAGIEIMIAERRLHIPGEVPEDFANAVVTVLLFGIAGGNAWDRIYSHSPDESLAWIGNILKANDTSGLVHSDIQWWEHQLRGH
jgi:hypothetical protein